MAEIYIKQRDTARNITDTLTLGGSAIDLTGATVVMVWRDTGTPANVYRRTTVTITDAAAGAVSYAPATADVASAGRFEFEWEITFGDSTILSVPTQDYHILNIEDDLDA